MGFDPVLTRQAFLRSSLAALFLPGLSLEAAAQAPSTSPLSVGDLAGAEKALGLSLSPDQRTLALDRAREGLKRVESIRALAIQNAIEPPLVFQPSGRKAQGRPGVSVRPTEIKRFRLPTNEADLAYLSIPQLRHLLRTKQISPVELTDVYLRRLQRYDPVLKCVVTLMAESARQEAKRAEDEIGRGLDRGPLHGVPYGLKDLFATKGAPTTWGAEAFKDQVIDADATVVTRLREAGAILLAKLSCGALAYDDVWFGGQTKNPWDTSQGSSGSSAGSACAAAAGLAAFTIGTETLGSILSPSIRCRVSGLRPTYGRVSRYGAMQLSWTNDKVGPICRSMEDCAIVLGALVGSDPLDPSAVDRPYHWSPASDLKGLRIGVLEQKEEPDWVAVLRAEGAEVRPVTFQAPPDGVLTSLLVEAAAAFDRETRGADIERIGKLWPPEFLAARFVSAVDYIQALRARTLLAERFERELGDLDAVVGANWGDSLLFITNSTGHPQGVIPWGTDGEGGGQSVSVVGRLYGEATVAQVAHRLQSARNFHLRRPRLTD